MTSQGWMPPLKTQSDDVDTVWKVLDYFQSLDWELAGVKGSKGKLKVVMRDGCFLIGCVYVIRLCLNGRSRGFGRECPDGDRMLFLQRKYPLIVL